MSQLARARQLGAIKNNNINSGWQIDSKLLWREHSIHGRKLKVRQGYSTFNFDHERTLKY